jgi:hypothetical protein
MAQNNELVHPNADGFIKGNQENADFLIAFE